MPDPATPDPVPPSPSEVPALPPGQELRPNIAAALACILPIFGGIVFLVLEKKNRYVRFYAIQSVLLNAATILGFIIVVMICAILRQIPFLGAVMVFLIWLGVFLATGAVWLIMAGRAYQGVEWELPILGPIARKQLDHGPLGRI